MNSFSYLLMWIVSCAASVSRGLRDDFNNYVGASYLAGHLLASAVLGSMLSGILIPMSALVIMLLGLALRPFW